MNWVEVVWPLVAALSLAFGLLHLLLWWIHEHERVHLALAIAAFSLATVTVLERLALFSASPELAATVIRWMHVPVAFMVAGLVYIVHASFGTGSTWLAGSVVGLRLLGLPLDFTTGVNLNFLRIDRIEWNEWAGVSVAMPVGPANPAVVVPLLSNLLLLAWLAQTLVRGLRLLPGRRRALYVVCGAGLLLGVVLLGAQLSWLFDVPRLPLTLPSVLVLLLAIGWQLGDEFIRWHRLDGLLRQSELRRLRTERELDMAAVSSGLGLWHWDVGGGAFTQNGNNRRMLGDAATGEGYAEMPEPDTRCVRDAATALFARVAPDEVAQVRERFDTAIRQPSYEFEYPVQDRDGGRHWIFLRGSAEHDADGMPLQVRGMTQDVSRQRSAEEQLRAVLDASPIALLVVDEGGTLRYANEHGAGMFGYAASDMRGMAVDLLLPRACAGGRFSRWCEEGRRTLRSGQVHGGDLMAVASGGREFPVDIVLSPLCIDGRAHVVAAVEDLSERRRMEQEAAFERESMAHMSRVTLVGEISGSLAHELNQPLAAILSNAQAAQRILRRDPGDIADIREILDDIVENDRRAGEVISRLRGLLKKEFRAFAPVSVNELVHDSIRIIRNDLVNRGVEYRLDLGVPICRVHADAVQLQQVILNLVINACDAMGEAATKVLTLRTRMGEAGCIRVEVGDSGPGVSEHMLEAIFAPFQTSKASGMGMGLAICRTLLRAHGGRIWATNAAEGGAVFCFELPVLE